MTSAEIIALVGFASLVVERFASHMTAKRKTEEWVLRKFDQLADNIRKEHAECRRELAEIRDILSYITPENPAE